MRRYLHGAKPLLYLGLLYWVVAWSLEHRVSLAFWLIAVPALVGYYVHNRAMEAQFSFDLYISMRGAKDVADHPYMQATQQAWRNRNLSKPAAQIQTVEQLKEYGTERWFKEITPSDEELRLESSGFCNPDGTRLLYHKGLIWSEKEKTFISKVYLKGRYHGDALGPEDSPEAAIEPSILIEENCGVISVLLVPVQPVPPQALQTSFTPREASIIRAWTVLRREARDRLLKRESRPDPSDPYDDPGSLPAVKLGEFPVREFMSLEYALTRKDKAWLALAKKYGLVPMGGNSWPHSPLCSEYVTFEFKAVK